MSSVALLCPAASVIMCSDIVLPTVRPVQEIFSVGSRQTTGVSAEATGRIWRRAVLTKEGGVCAVGSAHESVPLVCV